MNDLLEHYLNWPWSIDDPAALYSRIRSCMKVDKPTWIIEGRLVGCKPYSYKGTPFNLKRHFPNADYAAALWAIVREYENRLVFQSLREREFNSMGQHIFQDGYIVERVVPVLDMIDFGEVAA